MGLTALQAMGDGLGAIALADYRGATMAARFGDPEEEFAALSNGCGVYDLGFRAKISVSGGDRVRWLNGMVTNNVRDLGIGNGVYAFLLNPQGRILGDLYAFNSGGCLTVDTDRSQLDKILATFDHYIIMDDVEIKDVSHELTAIGISGPASGKVLVAAGFPLSEMHSLQVEPVTWNGADCTLVRNDQELLSGYEIWVAPGQVKQVWNALKTAGATTVGCEALEMSRIVAGIPRYGVDIRERDLPQETEQTRALNFSKGCYVGQEIVERIRSRGAVHRKFCGFVCDGAAAISAGTKIVASEKEVGEITSVTMVRSGAVEKTVMLGYIRREIGTPGCEITIGGANAIVAALPFGQGAWSQAAQAIAQRPA